MDVNQQAIVTTLESLEKTASRKEKEAILKAAFEGPNADAILRALTLANDPYLVFGVTADSDASIQQLTDDYSWNDFSGTLQAMYEGVLTGSKAKEDVRAFISTKDSSWNKWASRIINKDLRVGAAAKTINKAAGREVVKEFQVALCEPLDPNEEGADNLVSLLGNKFIIEPKLDGWRCVAYVRSKTVLFYTRAGKFIANTHLIEQELLKIAGSGELVYDGELKADSFESTEKILGSNVTELDPALVDTLKFHVFDVVEPKYFFSQGKEGVEVGLETRKAMLKEKAAEFGPHLVEIPWQHFHPINLAQYEAHLTEGHEGSILKNKELPYRFSRSTTQWYKIKPTLDCDLAIVGFEEGTGKHSSKLGALLVEGQATQKDSTVQVKVSVGSGLTDALRTEIWSNKELYLGKVVEVAFQNLSRAEGSDTWSLRFPRYKRLKKDRVLVS